MVVARRDGGGGVAKPASTVRNAASGASFGNPGWFAKPTAQANPFMATNGPGFAAKPAIPAGIARPNYSTAGAKSSGSGKGAQTLPAPRTSGGSSAGRSYSGGPVSTNSLGAVSEVQPAPAPTPLSFDQWQSDGNNYANDATFMSEQGSANSDYNNLIAQLANQNKNYISDMETGLRNMGLDFTGNDYAGGKWDPTDQLGAYGQAFRNMQNDYSGRGLLDSSFYGQAQQDLGDNFDRQRNSILDQLAAENRSYESNRVAAGNSRDQAINRARTEAYNRYVSGFGA